MTGRERVWRIFNRQPVDRVGLYEQLWDGTFKKYEAEGKLTGGIPALADRFGLDIMYTGGINYEADPTHGLKIIAQDERSITYLDGNGATMRFNTLQDGVYEHIGYQIKCREDWERLIKPRLTPTENRLAVEYYRESRRQAAENGRFLAFYSSNTFSFLTALLGHEDGLLAMAEDPDWVLDMTLTYAELQCQLQEKLFEAEGWPDCLWYTEDLGYKFTPFMSPAMFRELILPGYRKTFAQCHAHGCKVVLHSCGFMEPMIPDLLDAGLDALQAMEVKAGMDAVRIKETYGDRLVLIGGLDARVLESNDLSAVTALLEEKLPRLMEGGGYILHSDHSISPRVEYETLAHFLTLGSQIGTY